MSEIDDLLRELQNGKTSQEPLMVLDENKYDKIKYDSSMGRWIVKSKNSNRYYTLPGTPDVIDWKGRSQPISGAVVSGGSKKKSDNSGRLPIVNDWGTQEIKVDINNTEIDSVTKQVLFGKISIEDYSYNLLTTPLNDRKYSGSGDKYTDTKGNISFYYNPNSKSWRMGLRDGTTQSIPSGSVPISVWNKAGLVKPTDVVLGGVSSISELNDFLSRFNTFSDARNAGLNLIGDPKSANWFKPNSDEIAFRSPDNTTYLKESSGDWLVSGPRILDMYGKETMTLSKEYTPLEFYSDMNERSGWKSPLTSGVKNMWSNKYGNLSSIDPALLKEQDQLKALDQKKRNQKKLK